MPDFAVPTLPMRDSAETRAFYEKLGFEPIHGDVSQNWLILQNGTSTIGLFHGMFERNMLTFNPGWANKGPHPEQFDDIREIQRVLKSQGIALTMEADASSTGPASVMLTDPDGNPILLDQHVPRPAR